LARLAKDVNDIRANQLDEYTNIQAKFASLQTNCKVRFIEVQESVNTERSARERAVTSMRTDFCQQIEDLKHLFELKSQALEQDQQRAVQRFITLVDDVHTDVAKSFAKNQELFNSLVDQHQTSLNQSEVVLCKRIGDHAQRAAGTNDEYHLRFAKIEAGLQNEIDRRAGAMKTMSDSQAAERMRREQDESAIMNMLEVLMRQIRDINACQPAVGR